MPDRKDPAPGRPPTEYRRGQPKQWDRTDSMPNMEEDDFADTCVRSRLAMTITGEGR